MRIDKESWWKFIIPATVTRTIRGSNGARVDRYERWLIFIWDEHRLA